MESFGFGDDVWVFAREREIFFVFGRRWFWRASVSFVIRTKEKREGCWVMGEGSLVSSRAAFFFFVFFVLVFRE